MKAKGRQNPWAQGAKDSWTLTDWFENTYARTAGPAKYLSLFSGKTKFTDPSVKKAIQQMLQVLNNKYLVGGVQGALGTAFVDGIGRVFGKKPSAQLYFEGGFVGGIALDQVNTSLKAGKTINSFFWPTINPKYGQPMVGAGDLAAAFKDSADVRTFLKYISSPAAGRSGFRPARSSRRTSRWRRAHTRTSSSGRKRRRSRPRRSFLFDGSDTLPGTLADDWGALLQNALQKPGSISSLLSDFQKKADKGVLDRISRQRPRERGRRLFTPVSAQAPLVQVPQPRRRFGRSPRGVDCSERAARASPSRSRR